MYYPVKVAHLPALFPTSDFSYVVNYLITYYKKEVDYNCIRTNKVIADH